MAYLNPTQTARPDFTWPVFRFMAGQRRSLPQTKVLAFTAPDSLDDGTLDVVMALKTLRELGFLTSAGSGEETIWSLAATGQGIAVDDYELFQRRLRSALFVRSDAQKWDLADGVAEDLCRALCWFLRSDPHADPFKWETAQQEQGEDTIFSNDTRWGAFQSWGAATGFTASAPQIGGTCIADCTTAIRQTIEDLLEPRQQVDALAVLRELRRILPALPGGELSEHFGFLNESELEVGPALSFALRRGEIEGWLKLEQRSDATTQIKLFNPDSDFSLLCSTVQRMEVARD
ncbi:protein DpdG [Streptomyces phytophilus]|uniref:protein DpdG n=1 Tax=Streptomyces phytophilus TaxID=722715 RepID=UPI0015EFDCC4|nr:protein DpdG [Streptomyces phytophilus]